jgi:hypothetical protein
MKSLLTTLLLLAFAPLAQCAIIFTTNNTGLAPSSISLLDWETTGITNVSGVGTITDNRSGTSGTDGDASAFGNLAAWSAAGNVTYSFTSLLPSTSYNIYANWYGNGTANTSVDVTGTGASSFSFGTISQTNSSALTGTGFAAYNDAVDVAGDQKNFVLLGTASTSPTGQLTIVSTKGTALAFGRYDAFAVAPVAVPEPTTWALALLGGSVLFAVRQRRARRA